MKRVGAGIIGLERAICGIGRARHSIPVAHAVTSTMTDRLWTAGVVATRPGLPCPSDTCPRLDQEA